jgi:hypothetical protein
MTENTIDNLSIQVTASAGKAASVFDRLASSAGRLRGAAQGASGGLRDMAQSAKDAGTATQRAGTQSGRAATKIRGAGKDAKKAGDNAKKGASGVSVFWNALKRVGSISFKGIKSALFDLPKYFGGKMISSVRQAALGVDKFFSSIKRIVFYRAIRTALKLITQGFSEGISNLYQWSSLVDGRFAASMDRLATASLYLKNSLAAMVSPLINAIAPAVDYVVDKFVDMFNIINQIFARLTGQSSYTAAKKVAAQWQDASSSASGSAKKAADEIKRTLLGFDEINRLNDNNDRTGGGGSNAGGNSAVGADWFETRSISSWINDMVSSGDFSLLGETIANKINNALSSINWSTIKANGARITDSITSLINGFIKKIDPAVFGKSIADAINTAVFNIDRFWSSIKWALAGLKIRLALIKFFSEIDVEKCADALTGKFRGLVTLIYNAIPKTQEEWNIIGTKIAGFIKRAITRIPWNEMGGIVGDLLVGALTTMKILAKENTLTNIANGIKTAIESACKRITPKQVQEWVGAILKDVLSAVGVLMSIDLKFGDVSISPLTLMAFMLTSKELIGRSISKLFGSSSFMGLGKSLSWAASITMLVSAGIQIGKVFNDLKNGKKIKASDICNIISSGLMSAGFALLNVNPVAGGVLLSIGAILKLIVSDVWVDYDKNYTKNLDFSSDPLMAENQLFTYSGDPTMIPDVKKSKASMKELKTVVRDGWLSIETDTSRSWSNVQDTVNNATTGIKNDATTKLTTLASQINATWQALNSDSTSKWWGIQSVVVSGAASIGSKALESFRRLYSNIKGIGWSGIGSAITNGIYNGLNSRWSWLSRTVSNLAGGLLRVAKSSLGIRSPSKLFKDEVGQMIGLGMAEGITDSAPSVMKSISDLNDRMLNGLTPYSASIDFSGDAAMATDQASYDSDSGAYTPNYAALADAMVSAMQRAGVGAVYLDGRQLAESINRETRRRGSPAIVF